MSIKRSCRVLTGLVAIAALHSSQALASQFFETAPPHHTKSPFGSVGAIETLQKAVSARRYSFGNHIESGQSYIHVHVPAPVQDSEVERWSRMLALSQAQQAVVNAALEWYRQEATLLGESHVGPLWRLSAELAACDAHTTAESCVPKAEALERQRREVNSRIEALDAMLFDKIMPLLAPTQHESWPRIALYRQRERSRYVTLHHHGSAVIDLSALLDDMDVKGVLTVEDPQGFAAVLCEYEQILTRLTIEFLRVSNEAMASGRLLSAQAGAVPAASRYEARWKALSGVENRMVEVNRAYLEILSAHLEQPAAELLTRWFDEGSYPEVFLWRPDHEALLEAALAIDGGPLLHSRITALEADFLEQRSRVEAAMVALQDKFDDEVFGKHPGTLKPAYEADWERLVESRTQLEASFASSLLELFESPPADLQVLAQQFTAPREKPIAAIFR